MLTCQASKYSLSLFDKFAVGKNTYIVSKLAKGGDLLEYCLRQPETDYWLSERRSRHIVRQIAGGIRDMHSKGLVHRDLKLLNIFVCSNSDLPKVKIGDFGMCCRI
jgi:meiosis-specific serine/threonine-protein kinase MEK1